MRERYLKRGHAVRWEVFGDQTWSIRLSERGLAEDDGRVFHARSLGESHEPSPLQLTPPKLIATIEALRDRGLEIERGAIATGVSLHDYRRARVSATWEEHATRLHLALIRRDPQARVILDLGAPSVDELAVGEIEVAAEALRTVEPRRFAAEADVTLEPCVTARLWPTLYGSTRSADLGDGNLAISQNHHPWNPTDGCGSAIVPLDVVDVAEGTLLDTGELPNVYRPSYRFPPRRLAFNLRGRVTTTRSGSAIRALVAAGDIVASHGRIELPVVCADDRGCYVARIAMTTRDWLTRIVSVTGNPVWYPYGAGSLGQRVVIEGATFTV